MYILVGILLIIVILFGVSSGMQSYATAQQAQATIEVAQVAQVSAWGNLITILAIALLVVLAVALVAAVLWIRFMNSKFNRAGSGQRSEVSRQMTEARPQGQTLAPGASAGVVEELTQLMLLDMLRSMRSSNPPASLPSGNGTGPHDVGQSTDSDEALQWLKRGG